jgi:hypothetical protein
MEFLECIQINPKKETSPMKTDRIECNITKNYKILLYVHRSISIITECPLLAIQFRNIHYYFKMKNKRSNNNFEAANKRCTFENVFVITLKVILIYNLFDTPVFNIWSIINARFDISEDSPEWKIYEITSLVTYDLLAMMNTLSFFIIFYQIFTISEKIAEALALNSEDFILHDKGNILMKDFRG